MARFLNIRLGLGLFIVGATSAAPAAAQQPERYTLSEARVAIYNLVGTARIEGGTGGDVVVEVRRGGADAGRLSVRTSASERGRRRQRLTIVYPSDRIVYERLGRGSQTTVDVDDDGGFDDDEPRHRRHDWDDHEHAVITGEGAGLHAYADLRVVVPQGRDVVLRLAAGEVTVANVNGRLQIDTGSGDLTAGSVRGTLALETGSGSVRLTGFDGSELSIDTGSGSVSGENLRASKIDIDTGSGDITVKGASASELSLSTGSGAVTSDLGAETRTVSVDTGSGDVTLQAPATLGAVLNIETGSGGIDSDFPVSITRHSSDHMQGQIGDGRGRISIDTGSGEVRLVRR